MMPFGVIVVWCLVGILVWIFGVCPLIGLGLKVLGKLLGVEYFVCIEDSRYIGKTCFVPTYWSLMFLGVFVSLALIAIVLILLLIMGIH